jgi:hypothetical protein
MGTGYTPTSIQDGFQSNDDINTELQAIRDDLEDKVDRTGRLPNSMSAQLDIGTNRILNVAEGTLGTDGVNLNQVTQLATAIATTILGIGAPTGSALPPTINYGTATGSQGLDNRTKFELDTLFGATAFSGLSVYVNGVYQTPGLAYTVADDVDVTFSESLNTDSTVTFVFGDISPTPVFSNVSVSLNEVAATATAGQTVFTAPTYVIGNNQLLVFIDGVKQTLALGDYTETTTTSITFDEAMAGGEKVVITNFTGL